MRNPESNVEVYALGTYEQMQLGLALDFALAHAAWAPSDAPTPEAPFNAKTVRGLLKVFGAYGRTTIIRENDKE